MEFTATTIPLLISATVFVSLILLFFGIFQYVRQQEQRRKLVGKIKGSEEAIDAQVMPDRSPRSPNLLTKGFVQALSHIGKRAVPKTSDEYSQVNRSFRSSGMRGENLPAVFWGTKFLLAALLPVSFLVVSRTIAQSLTQDLDAGLTLFLALLGFYLPNVWLRRKVEKRKEQIFQGLPDALDLLVVCVEAGMGLDAAILRVGEEMALSNKALSEEFKLFSLELRAGKLRKDALKNLADRIDLEDVHNLVSLLVQTDRFGTSVGDALRVYSDTFRSKRYMRAEEKAAKLPGQMMFPLILFIFPSLFVAILGPAAIRASEVMSQG